MRRGQAFTWTLVTCHMYVKCNMLVMHRCFDIKEIP